MKTFRRLRQWLCGASTGHTFIWTDSHHSDFALYRHCRKCGMKEKL